jgi:hypothetical protein
MKRILTLLIALQATTIGQPPAVSGNEPHQRSSQGVVLVRATATNTFTGTYCGYLDSRNYGSMSISDSGSVSGYFSYINPIFFSESFQLSGRVTAAGVMRLKVVHTITVNDRGRRTRTERYSVTVTVELDESGNLVATSGASFVLAPCQ